MDERVTLDDNLLSLIKTVQDEFEPGFVSILFCPRFKTSVIIILNNLKKITFKKLWIAHL